MEMDRSHTERPEGRRSLCIEVQVNENKEATRPKLDEIFLKSNIAELVEDLLIKDTASEAKKNAGISMNPFIHKIFSALVHCYNLLTSKHGSLAIHLPTESKLEPQTTAAAIQNRKQASENPRPRFAEAATQEARNLLAELLLGISEMETLNAISALDRDVPREEIMRALNDVMESGKVRYNGASSMAAWEFQTLQNIAEKHEWHKFVSMQNYYNLLYREEERETIPYCRGTGVGMIPWSPIARGALARPFSDRSTTRENSNRMLKSMVRGRGTKIDEQVIGKVEEIAKKYGASMTTIATAWRLSKDKVDPIIGLSNKEMIDQAVEAVKFASSGKLTEEDIKYFEEGYAPKERQSY
ncbi:related to aryl-alcohol dehydrogenases [Phialocephala subalpina]|uniref:Related to aryl-alcohol dehydrogenases n=1 Tax=Phialocephala subalpina TaxID=576137 RepID=A0A1L7WWE8_9HELO|nr:related to aryl-alcohol dehydrogenases [Phialocephala subalpina]